PCGDNLRYAPVMDQIKEARRQDDELNQGDWKREIKRADWNQVLKLGQKVLAEQSKDLQVVAWVTEALLQKEGVPGLTEGLNLTKDLLETYWDKLYPRFEEDYFEPEDLATPIEWIATQLVEIIREQAVSASGRTWVEYQDSRRVPTEDEASDNYETKGKVRQQAIKDGKLTPEEFESEFASSPKSFYADAYQDFDDALKAVSELDSLCQEKFADVAPGFAPLRKTLEEVQGTMRVLLVKKRELEPDPEPEPEPAEEEGVDGAVEPESAEPAHEEEVAEEKPSAKKKSGGTLSPDPTDEADAFRRVVNAAKYLRAQNPNSPVPYLLVRALRWGELRQSGSGYLDIRQFEPPSTEIRQQLKTASLDGDWNAVLEAAEIAAGDPCGRGWLDLQRYAITALKNIGYSAPADALVSLLRGIVDDFPDLVSQTMMDDTATANAETQNWLNVLFPPPPPPPPPPAPEPEPEPEPAYTRSASMPVDEEEVAPGEPDLYEQATEMAARGNVTGAISLLSGAVATERSGRGRFLRRVQLAQICIGAGKPGMARNILEEVVREVESRKLDEWESSDTLAHPMALLYQTMGDSEAEVPRKRELYARICRLDPSQALTIAPME
ncbi:MAG: type VI secretion system protein TssA, partial [Bryobacterales bacterium]|nr:type VI secretion system protein TssA [Bryobacterales bacterium]